MECTWIEAIVVDRLSRVYSEAGKYREVDQSSEIDCIVKDYLRTKKGVEVKNAPLKSAIKKQKNANNLAERLKLNEYVFTYSYNNLETEPMNGIENNKIILLLELANIIRDYENKLLFEPASLINLEVVIKTKLKSLFNQSQEGTTSLFNLH